MNKHHVSISGFVNWPAKTSVDQPRESGGARQPHSGDGRIGERRATHGLGYSRPESEPLTFGRVERAASARSRQPFHQSVNYFTDRLQYASPISVTRPISAKSRRRDCREQTAPTLSVMDKSRSKQWTKNVLREDIR